MGVGLVGLLLSTVAFAAAPVAPGTTKEIAVAASDPVMEENVVTARHPDAELKSAEFAIRNRLDLLIGVSLNAPGRANALLIKPEIRLNL